jgi:hypothetical protein
MPKMLKYYGNKYNANVEMTSMYNKLYNKRDGFFFSICHICI